MSKPDLLLPGAYPAWDLEALAETFALHRLWEAADTQAFLRDIGPRVRAVATRGDLGANAALMNALPALEIIACYGVGTDAIDLGLARSRGIAVTNTPDVLTNDVADMALALILAVLRRIPQGDAWVRSGEWAKGSMPLVSSLAGKRIGIVGLGRIGRAVAKRVAACETTVAYTATAEKADAPYPYYPTTTALARASDVLVVTASGGPATKHIISAEVLAALGPGGVLINVSRGSTVDEEALLTALSDGSLGAAGLDVFMNEPTPDPRFLRVPNLVVQPHHSSGTVETRRAMGQLVRDNLAAHFAGQPLLTPVL